MEEHPHRAVQNDILLRYFGYPLVRYTPFRLFLQMYNRVEYKGQENLRALKNKNFMMFCQHQTIQDPIYHGLMLKKILDDFGYFIMKGSLPAWFFGNFRGIRVIRRKDVAKGKFTDEQRKERNRKAYEQIMPRILRNNESIVIYPEGTRFSYGNKTEIKEKVLENIIDMKIKHGVPTNFIVVGSNYGENAGNIYRPLSTIDFIIGEPFEIPSDRNYAPSKIESEIRKVFTKEVSFIKD